MVAFGGLQPVAVTPAAGFALQNGTPVILTWNVPNDGQTHYVEVFGTRNVTSLETGGQVSVTFTPPNQPTVTNVLAAGGSPVGNGSLNNLLSTVAPGSVVTLQQTSALTAGACSVMAAILGF